MRVVVIDGQSGRMGQLFVERAVADTKKAVKYQSEARRVSPASRRDRPASPLPGRPHPCP